MEARNRKLKDWLMYIRMGQLLLPRFQRGEEWDKTLAARFLTSLVRGLPIGVALVLEVGDHLPLQSARPLETAPHPQGKVAELLLDGQQRLTVLWRALKDNYPTHTFVVDFGAEDGIEVVSQGIREQHGRKYPLWLSDPAACWKRKKIPFRLLDPEGGESARKQWALDAAEGKHELAWEIDSQIGELRSRIEHTVFPYLSLPATTPIDVAIQVFLSLNTTFVKLSTFDIVVAEVESAAAVSLREEIAALLREVPGLGRFRDVEDIVLYAGALLQDRLPNERGCLGMDMQQFARDLDKIRQGTARAVRFLHEERVYDAQRIPTAPVIPPLIALWANAPTHPDAEGNVRILLRKYLWRAFFTERYDRAVATAVLQDYRALRSVITEGADEAIVPIFDHEQYPLPEIEDLKQAGWPHGRSRLARAILLLSLRAGAHDIADESPVSPENIGRREYHHLFPVAFLRSRGIDEKEANKALNCILITWSTNRVIGARSPLEYLRARADRSSLGEEQIRCRLRTHLVDFDTLAQGDYEAFLQRRAEMCMEAIQALCAGRNWPS